MPLFPGKPENPGTPEVVFFTVNSIWIEWRRPANVKQSITGYLVQYRVAAQQGNTEWVDYNVLGRSTVARLKNLNTEGIYEFRVAAHGLAGWGLPSNSLIFKLKDPKFPLNLKSSNVAQDSATLTWDRPQYKGYDPGADGHFIVESLDSGQSRSTAWIQHAAISSSDTSTRITGLVPGKNYTFRVRIEYSERHEDQFKLGRSSPADVNASDNITCFTSVNPAKPSSPQVNITKTLQLVWDPPRDTGGSELMGYYVERKKDGTDEWVRFADELTSVPTFRVLHTNLKDGKYMFRVVAVNAGGLHSEPSEPSETYTNKIEIKSLAATKAITENQSKNTPAHRRLQSEGYRNYVKSLVAIQVFCKESVPFCDKVVKDLHNSLISDPKLLKGKYCLNHIRECNPLKDKKSWGSACSNCQEWVKVLKKKAVDKELSRGKVIFRDISSNPWEMAKLFMIRQHKTIQNKTMGQEFDTASLLHLMGSCKCFHTNHKTNMPDEYNNVLYSRNELMHLEIKKGLRIRKTEMDKHFNGVEVLVVFVENEVEPDASVFPAAKILKELQRVKKASIDDLVAVEDDVVGEIIDEYEAEKLYLEEEMRDEKKKDPEKVRELEERIAELSTYLHQYEDLWETFGDRLKNLNLDKLKELLADQSLDTTEEATQGNEDASQDLIQLQKDLTIFYTVSFGFVDLLPAKNEQTISITDLQTDLYFIDSHEDNIANFSSYEELLNFKTDAKPFRKFLILGKEGVGKTTYVKRIAYDWASIQLSIMEPESKHNQLHNYQLVAALDARRINSGDDVTTTIIKQLVPAKSSFRREFLELYIRKNPEKVLIILDGFTGGIDGILRDRALQDCTIILTCRPQHQTSLGDLLEDYFPVKLGSGETEDSEEKHSASEDEIRSLQNELALHYNLSYGYVELLPRENEKSIPITDLRTDLDLLPSQKRSDNEHLSSYEDLLNLTIDGASIKRFLILGKEGIGKTTYTRRIAYDWAAIHLSESDTSKVRSTSVHNPLSNYQLVLALDARRIEGNDDIATAVTKQLLPSKSSYKREILETYIRRSPERVLIMLDGLIGEISGILNDTVLNGCTIMLTLRPQHQTAFGNTHQDYVPLEITRLAGLEDTRDAGGEDEVRIQQLPERLQPTAIAVRNICYNYQSIPHERLREQAAAVITEIKKLKLEELQLVMTGTTTAETVTQELYSMKHLHIGNFHRDIASIIREKSERIASRNARGVKE